MIAGTLAFGMRDMRDHAASLRQGLSLLDEDRNSVACEQGIVVGSAASGVWEDSADPAPFRSLSGRLISFDGRIDNGDDLGIQLHGDLRERSNAALAMATFDRWGIEGLGRIVGEWSAAIWDAPLRTLHLARDYMGVRPLYYAVDAAWVMWSSHLGELALRAGQADALSEAFAATAIVQEISPELTPYAAVRAVPPGWCVSVDATGVQTRRRFWSIGSNTMRLRRDGDYEEALRSLWCDAVRVRLRTTQPVWAELSGGLDSSSVVCMADALMRDGRVDAGRLHLVSHATLESPEGDERRFIAEVENRVGVRSDVLGLEQHRVLVDEDWGWASPFAAHSVLLACLRHVRSRGGRVILSGRMGDTVMGCQPDNSLAAFDDFADGGILRGLASIRRWSRASRQPFWLTSYRLLRWLADDGGAESGAPAGTTDSLLTPRLRTLAAAHRAAVDPLPDVRPAKRQLARLLLAYSSTSRLDLPVQPPGITYTYPFAHRPLVEFVMAIPGGVLTAPGGTRTLMRRAFAGFVPPRVLGRQSKGFYPPAALRGLRAMAARMPPATAFDIVERGWVDAAALAAALRALVDAGVASQELRRALRLEDWLASRKRRGLAAIPQRREVTTNGVHHA